MPAGRRWVIIRRRHETCPSRRRGGVARRRSRGLRADPDADAHPAPRRRPRPPAPDDRPGRRPLRRRRTRPTSTASRVQVAPDGGVWFLEASADRVAVFADGDDHLLADPALRRARRQPRRLQARRRHRLVPRERPEPDPGGHLLVRQARHRDEPASSPSGSSRARSRPPSTGRPTGPGWVPQTGGRPPVTSTSRPSAVTRLPLAATYAYADMVVGAGRRPLAGGLRQQPDRPLVPGATSETSWTFFDLVEGRLEPVPDRVRRPGHTSG